MGFSKPTVLEREAGGEAGVSLEELREARLGRSNPLRLIGHDSALEGVRGLAILMVLLVHLTPEGRSHTVVGAVMKAVAGVGVAGVDLFFVLSGFLITGILLEAKGKGGYLRTFYARRALRIFPLYYLVLVLCLVVAPRVMRMDSPEYRALFAKQGWLWFYVGNIKTAMGTEVCPFSAGWLQFDHFWSLAIEEQFYLVWPVLVLLLSRRGMMGVCWGLMAGALGLRWWLYWRGDPTMAFYTLTL
jgi:peptidoglycan/LPS O-acetylase OafA/YrhL